MRINRYLTSVLVAALSLVGLTACGSNDHHSRPQVVQQGPTTTQTSVDTQSYLLDTTKFDLGLVRGLVQSGKVSNPADLEKAVNDRSTGINNVDVDGDGNTDFVGVQEKPSENGKIALSFVAQPSSGTGAPVEIAEISITQNTQTSEVTISGGYSHHVSGYNTYYAPPTVYHHNDLSFAEAYLLVSLMRPHSPYMYNYNPYYYAPRPVMTPTAMNTTRTSYTTVNKVTTVSPVSKNSSAYKSGMSTVSNGSNQTYTNKTSSSLASPSKATGGGSMNSYSDSMKSYTATDPSKKSQSVSAFSAPATTSTASKPATTSSSSWGAPSSSTTVKTTTPTTTSSWGKPSTTPTTSSSWNKTPSSTPKPTTSSSWGAPSPSSRSWSSSPSRSRRR